ncbi:hypothetical protein E5288_WYG022066 [Bos mutus]|uniref:Uncharacterized protein n=1 Tax=Bos mutus TaxID=72004 RepID=A0A6B0RXH2_9CETA|nr:hypothetical protein [Bos mutus]
MADFDPRYPCSSIEDDFNYGSCVASASVHIRMAFLRKVYSILSLQVLLTTVTLAFFLYFDSIRTFVHESPALILVLALGSLGLILALTVNRHKHPLNLYLLFGFTVCWFVDFVFVRNLEGKIWLKVYGIRLVIDGPQHCCADLPVRRAGYLECDLDKEVWQPQGIRSALSSEACCLLLYLFQVHFIESDQSFLIVHFLLKACLLEGCQPCSGGSKVLGSLQIRVRDQSEVGNSAMDIPDIKMVQADMKPPWTAQLKSPTLDLLRNKRIDLMNQILHADDATFTKKLSDPRVTRQGNSLSVDFAIGKLVDQFIC